MGLTRLRADKLTNAGFYRLVSPLSAPGADKLTNATFLELTSKFQTRGKESNLADKVNTNRGKMNPLNS